MPVIRKLLAHEGDALKQHLLRLDAEDRRLRFGHVVTAEVVLAYVDAIRWRESWLVGAFEGDSLRGVAELRDLGAPDSKAGEISVTVEGAWQNRGIGNRLLEEVLLVARNRGFGTLYLLCLPDNAKMQHLARKFAESMSRQEGDIEVRIRTRQPDAFSACAEIFGDVLALWETALDRLAFHVRPAPPLS